MHGGLDMSFWLDKARAASGADDRDHAADSASG
jgi:hypothetical protein